VSHVAVLIAAAQQCEDRAKSSCAASGPAVAFLLVGAAVLVAGAAYLWHRPSRDERPRPRTRRSPPPPRPRLEESASPTSDVLEYLGERSQRLSVRRPGSKLTYLSWITRWWASGPFMRRILIRQTLIFVAVCAAGVVAWLVLR